MNEEQQRRLATELRATLETVVIDENERRLVEAELDAALSLPAPEGDAKLADVLRARPETRAWMRERDPDAADAERMTGLAGLPTAKLGTYFVCPAGDYDFVRESVSDDVPLCPTHQTPLISQAD
jgi:hypothetical protein